MSTTKSKRSGQIWMQQPSGILIPAGRVSDISISSKTNYLEIKDRAKQIEEIYKNSNIKLPQNSGLGELIKTAKDLSDNWLLGNRNNLNYRMVFLSMHLYRVADAVILLTKVPDRDNYLKRLLSGSLNFSERGKSNAKDVFWELEAWGKIRKRLDSVYLKEPPDIVVDYGGSRIGISCKKLYSERNVEHVLSEAVSQIEKGFEFGIVALNIDDLLSPADVPLKKENSSAVTERLNQINTKFIDGHIRHFRKYLSASRIISAIVSTAIIADIPSEKPRFRNTSNWTVWTITELKERHRIRLEKFYKTIMS